MGRKFACCGGPGSHMVAPNKLPRSRNFDPTPYHLLWRHRATVGSPRPTTSLRPFSGPHRPRPFSPPHRSRPLISHRNHGRYHRPNLGRRPVTKHFHNLIPLGPPLSAQQGAAWTQRRRGRPHGLGAASAEAVRGSGCAAWAVGRRRLVGAGGGRRCARGGCSVLEEDAVSTRLASDSRG